MTSVVGLNARSLNTRTGIPRIQTFWQLTHQSLLIRLTLWSRTTCFAPESPNLGYFTVQSIRRLCMQHSNLEAQLEPGGLPTSPPYLLITMFHGASSVLPSALTIYLWVCSTLS
jgi:hypothetical protein